MRLFLTFAALLTYNLVFSQLVVNSNQTISSGTFDGAEINAELRITGGTVTFTNTVDINSGGSLIIESGTVNIQNDLKFNDTGITIIVEAGATLNVTNSSDDAGNAPTFIINGTVNVGNDFKNSGTVSGSGNLTVANSTDNTGTIFGDTSGNPNCSGGCSDPALPIVLLEFNVTPAGSYLDISWVSLTEINNDFYTLYRSYDGINFEQIAIINGAGNSIERLTYTYKDYPSSYGLIYYKLRQTDFDGQFEEFPLAVVTFEGPDNLSPVIYPTVLKSGEQLLVKNFWGTIKTVDLVIIDISGKAITNPRVDLTNDNLRIETDFLTPGVYILSGSVNNILVQGRFVLK